MTAQETVLNKPYDREDTMRLQDGPQGVDCNGMRTADEILVCGFSSFRSCRKIILLPHKFQFVKNFLKMC